MVRFYILPIIGTGTGRDDSRRPKYIADADLYAWVMMDYGRHDVCLVRVSNITQAQHDALILNADVIAFPEDLSGTITQGVIDNVSPTLEDYGIPVGWVSPGMTYRAILKVIAGMFQFAQRWHGMGGGDIFASGVTLSTTYSQLPQAAKTRLQQVADSFGWNYSSVTGATTIRQMLKLMADQWTKPILMGGDVF